MAELATIARPYAEALFQAVRADLAAAQAWVDEFATVASDAALLQFAGNPSVTATQVIDVISGVVKTTPSDASKNFLRTVVENGRLEALPEIARQFRALKNAQSGVSDAVIYSAFPIEGGALADVQATLEKRFARKLNVQVAQDAGLIGGIRVVVGDEVFDTSVKARLEQMKAALTA